MITMNAAVRRTALLLSPLLLVLAACGGSSSGPSAGAPPTGTTTSGETPAPSSGASTGPSGVGNPTTVPTPIVVDGTTAQYKGQVSAVGKTTAEVDMGDLYFTPTVITATPGTQLQVTVVNQGKVKHTFTIADQQIDLKLDSGKRDTVMVKVPASGVVGFVCTYHLSSGMVGEFATAG